LRTIGYRRGTLMILWRRVGGENMAQTLLVEWVDVRRNLNGGEEGKKCGLNRK
jgi:hypothetical protein